MGTTVHCDLCGVFIAEYGFHQHKQSDLARIHVVDGSYSFKSVLEEGIGWSGTREEIKFWACDTCREKFMTKMRAVAKELGLEKA
jgi:hypothetical protein